MTDPANAAPIPHPSTPEPRPTPAGWDEVDTSTEDTPAGLQGAPKTQPEPPCEPPDRPGSKVPSKAAAPRKEAPGRERRGAPTPAPAPTERAVPGSSLERLSSLLRKVTPEELRAVLKAYPAALERGVIKAVRLLERPPFEVQVIGDAGDVVSVTVPEELVQVSPGWRKWLAEERKKGRYEVRALRGESRAREADLRSGEEDFERLFEIRRQAMRAGKEGA